MYKSYQTSGQIGICLLCLQCLDSAFHDFWRWWGIKKQATRQGAVSHSLACYLARAITLHRLPHSQPQLRHWEHQGQLPVSRRQRFKAPLERKTGRPERQNGFDVVVVIFPIMKFDKSPLSSAAIPSHLSNELNAPFLFCMSHALASRLS